LRRWKRSLFLFGTLLGGALLFLLIRLFLPSPFTDPRQLPSGPSSNQDLESFLKGYWQTPIALQGPPPPSYSKLEASLSPEACGSCHAQQHADWKESLHSRAMGPGPWGQIIDLTRNSPEEAVQCMTCHAPLSEQIPVLLKTTKSGDPAQENNPHFDPKLQSQGIVCAACHVRNNERFGPPKAESTTGAPYPPGTPNHGGVQRTSHFERAEFCRDCHQFDPENSVLVNGKPLEYTYREWQTSTWAKDGAACQDCHMSNRRHLWKGIHDQEWVKGAVRVESQLKNNAAAGAPGSLDATVDVVNAAVGHRFPTYITPKVFVRAALLDDRDQILPGTQQERIIGWDARFEAGEWKEYFDTRISPGEKFQAIFKWPPTARARKLRAWVEVHPDHFYHVYFYPAYLQGENLSPEGRNLIEKALKDSGNSYYVIFNELIPLN